MDTISTFPISPGDSDAALWLDEFTRGNACFLSNGLRGPALVVYTFAIRLGHGGTATFLPDYLRRQADARLLPDLQDSEIEITLARLAEAAPELYITGSPDFIQRTERLAKKMRLSFSLTTTGESS